MLPLGRARTGRSELDIDLVRDRRTDGFQSDHTGLLHLRLEAAGDPDQRSAGDPLNDQPRLKPVDRRHAKTRGQRLPLLIVGLDLPNERFVQFHDIGESSRRIELLTSTAPPAVSHDA